VFVSKKQHRSKICGIPPWAPTCLDAKGAIDPDTGLLANAVFWRDLNRAVDNADKRGAALSIARFSLPAANRRISLEAARLVGPIWPSDGLLQVKSIT
jgi:hypothetical protein